MLGTDGFCGWPTSLHFGIRARVIVDNLARHNIDIELEGWSPMPV
jgi:UDP-sulfoquinovose synthase